MMFTTPFFADEIQKLKPGDFAHYRNSPFDNFGIVSKMKDSGVELALFDNGYPYVIYAYAGYIGPADEQEFIDHLDSIVKRLEETTAQGGLKGAISARRQYGLQSVKEHIIEKSSLMAEFVKFPEPQTGTYVLMGIYSGQGESDQLQGIQLNQRISENSLASIVFEIHPRGLGTIPTDIYNTPATSHGGLVGYRAFEVPPRALGFVENPINLKIIFDE